jgi:hypothetical protein
MHFHPAIAELTALCRSEAVLARLIRTIADTLEREWSPSEES